MATSTSLATGAPAGDAFHTPPIPVPDGAPGDPIHARPLDNPAAAYPLTLLGHFLDQGWAVAMTDYEALGTGTPQRLLPYLCGRSEAMGVLDIVTAARRLFPGEIGVRFAIAGHSQGGQAALFAAHHAPGRVDGLAGVAAIAPANHLLGLVRGGATLDQVNSGFAFTPLLLAGALGGDPTIDPEQVLSPRAFQELWPHVQDRSRAGLNYRRYEPGTVPADEPLGIHFATIGHDTPGLTEWLAALLTAAGPRS
ncbi:lipase family protein [Streptomyces sp. MT29]|nr:lipase family protein [Streptomyces sp. MT29]